MTLEEALRDGEVGEVVAECRRRLEASGPFRTPWERFMAAVVEAWLAAEAGDLRTAGRQLDAAQPPRSGAVTSEVLAVLFTAARRLHELGVADIGVKIANGIREVAANEKNAAALLRSGLNSAELRGVFLEKGIDTLTSAGGVIGAIEAMKALHPIALLFAGPEVGHDERRHAVLMLGDALGGMEMKALSAGMFDAIVLLTDVGLDPADLFEEPLLLKSDIGYLGGICEKSAGKEGKKRKGNALYMLMVAFESALARAGAATLTILYREPAPDLMAELAPRLTKHLLMFRWTVGAFFPAALIHWGIPDQAGHILREVLLPGELEFVPLSQVQQIVPAALATAAAGNPANARALLRQYMPRRWRRWLAAHWTYRGHGGKQWTAALLYAAEAHARAGDWPNARQLFREAIASAARIPRGFAPFALCDVARVLARCGHPAELAPVYRRLSRRAGGKKDAESARMVTSTAAFAHGLDGLDAVKAASRARWTDRDVATAIVTLREASASAETIEAMLPLLKQAIEAIDKPERRSNEAARLLALVLGRAPAHGRAVWSWMRAVRSLDLRFVFPRSHAALLRRRGAPALEWQPLLATAADEAMLPILRRDLAASGVPRPATIPAETIEDKKGEWPRVRLRPVVRGIVADPATVRQFPLLLQKCSLVELFSVADEVAAGVPEHARPVLIELLRAHPVEDAKAPKDKRAEPALRACIAAEMLASLDDAAGANALFSRVQVALETKGTMELLSPTLAQLAQVTALALRLHIGGGTETSDALDEVLKKLERRDTDTIEKNTASVLGFAAMVIARRGPSFRADRLFERAIDIAHRYGQWKPTGFSVTIPVPSELALAQRTEAAMKTCESIADRAARDEALIALTNVLDASAIALAPDLLDLAVGASAARAISRWAALAVEDPHATRASVAAAAMIPRLVDDVPALDDAMRAWILTAERVLAAPIPYD